MNAYRIANALMLALLALPSAMAAACDSSPFRQFDFWLGEWQVHTPDGKLAGTNRIERQYDGCVIHEHYTTSRGYSGESLNLYDEPRKVWHQTWIDNSGTLLTIEGQFLDGKMVLQGQSTGSDAIEQPLCSDSVEKQRRQFNAECTRASARGEVSRGTSAL